ncbi:hypothetical protein KC721_00585 [Candidatus Woesebacteria bacterium]|nr:hypothetical protein [Candidatus Woesebacteria bacterium]
MSDKKSSFSGLGDVFADYEITENKYISQEFQDFGYQLAVKLNDLKHKSLYIKMAKEVDRSVLEQALRFVTDADSAKSKARLFMWKVKQLRDKKKV